MNGQGAVPADGRAERVEVVVQRFAAGDHHEGRARCGRLCAGQGQVLKALLRVHLGGPGVLGVAPAATDRAAPETNEKGAAPGMESLPLQGVEGLHNRKSGCIHCRCSSFPRERLLLKTVLLHNQEQLRFPDPA